MTAAGRHVDVREVVNGLMYILSTGANGAPSRRICRRARPSTITSTFGVGTARSSASTRRSTSSAGKPPLARRARPPRSSTARASRARKKGGAHRRSCSSIRRESIARDVDVGYFSVGHDDSLGIGVCVEFAADSEAGLGRGGADQVDDHAIADERLSFPVHGDEREKAVLDLVPLCAAEICEERSNAAESYGS